MKKTTPILLLALLGLLSCKTQQVQKVDADPQSTEIKFISYNIRQSGAVESDSAFRWENRKQASLNMIAKEAPHIFGLQEATQTQIEYLEKNCPAYKRVGVGRDDGKKAGEYMAIFYSKATFSLLKQKTYWLSETPTKVSRGWDGACNRTLTYTKLKHRATGKMLHVFNTHFDHQGSKARLESGKLVADCISQLTDTTDAILLCGDFNAEISNRLFEPLKTLLQQGRLCAPITDSLPTFNAWGRGSTGIIDHFFCKNVTCCRYATLTGDYGAPYISDHYPIEFVFELKP
jgi:endonuclease/exonuclease/phosphatase family metal-dependent hydrolase